jgi:hypothetical protein
MRWVSSFLKREGERGREKTMTPTSSVDMHEGCFILIIVESSYVTPRWVL